MASKQRQCCGTCKWGNFTMTNHNPPRINKNLSGRCGWPIPKFDVAISVRGMECIYKVSVASGFEGCPVWAAREK